MRLERAQHRQTRESKVRNARLAIFTAASIAIFGFISEAEGSIIDVSGTVREGDFDGDDVVETVFSSPETDCGKGAVYVITADGALTTWSRDTSGILGTAACDDLFGASLAVGDFDGDGYDDLAIAAPGANDTGYAASGSVHVLYGSAAGLSAAGDQLWTPDSSGIDGFAQANDHFGDALATGDFNCDGADDLAIGGPRRPSTTGTVPLLGKVNMIFGGSGGLSSVDDREVSGSGGNFGAALAAGNFNGDQASGVDCDDLAVAAPNETVGTASQAGRLRVFPGVAAGSATPSTLSIDQDVTGVVDTAEGSDRFGWRLAATTADTDAYDDLLVTVPGDACTSSVGTGRHLFHGSVTGITTSGNEVICDTYGCSVFEDRILACHSGTPPVYGTPTSEVVGLARSNGIAWGGDGADEFHGGHGNDILFGGAGEDIIEGGPGRDMIIAGSGDDTIIIDLDCMVLEGEVVDGGAGSDTIRSHLSSTELLALGVTLVSIENFVLIDEDPRGASACVATSYEDGPFLRPRVSVLWPGLPTSDSVLTSSTGIIPMVLQNISADDVVVDLEFVMRVRGEDFQLEQGPVTVVSNTSEAITLDLNDFIPTEISPSGVNPALLVLPTSASISARARLTVDSEHAGYSFSPAVFGHLEITRSGGSSIATTVLYREGALHSTYHHGDLARWRANAPAYTGAAKFMGRSEAHGSLGIPGY